MDSINQKRLPMTPEFLFARLRADLDELELLVTPKSPIPYGLARNPDACIGCGRKMPHYTDDRTGKLQCCQACWTAIGYGRGPA